MNENRAHEIVEEEWGVKDSREKVEAIDPDGNREMFLDFCFYARRNSPAAWERIVIFLDEQGETWREHRAQQLMEQDEPEYEPEIERG